MSRNERGAAAVEFALVLPLLVLLFAGIAEFSRIYHLQATLAGAAREGARVMAVQNDVGTTIAAVQAAAGPVALTGAQIDVTPGTGACRSTFSSTPAVQVQARVTITVTTPLVTSLFLPAVTVHGRGVMQCGG